MQRVIVLLSVIVGIAGCDAVRSVDPTPVSNPVPPPPPTTFTVEGTVRSEAGFFLAGAKVKLTDARNDTRETTTNATGQFFFSAVAGAVRLMVTHENYRAGYSNLVVLGDQNVSFVLIYRDSTDARIVEGEILRSYIDAGDSPCDPVGWDAQAPCRRLKFVASRSGVLTVSVTWAGQSDLDFTIMTPQGEYLAYGSGGRPTVATSLMVYQGVEYEVWVHSYYGEQTFELLAGIQP